MGRWQRLWRHIWMDAADTRRAIPDDMGERLSRRVAASERRHTGEVRICVEAALSPWDVWQSGGTRGEGQGLVRERALQWFGQLHVWDTEQNNGVLVYLLLAERAIEIVADRDLARRVAPSEWSAIVTRLSAHLGEGRFEDGLTQALEEVSALLVAHYPATKSTPNPNELPDAVVRA